MASAEGARGGVRQLYAYVHLAAFAVAYADDVYVGAGALEEMVAHHASHGVGVDAHAVGLPAYGAVEVQTKVNHPSAE